MKLICAPMATLSHPAFRMLIEEFGGCDEYYTEMINAPSLLNNGQFEKFYINPAPAPEKIVWQLTGKSAGPIVEAATVLASAGGIGVDLNMGCSAPDIVNSGAGIAWMLKPRSETLELVRGVKNALEEYEAKTGIHRRFSVKFRLGDENFTDESFFSFSDMLVENGVEWLALHPRTKKEKYRDLPRWSYAEKLAERYSGKISVVVNGDIKDFESAKKAEKECASCEGLMIGRMAVQKPWIFAEISRSLSESCPEKHPVDLLKCSLDFIDFVEKFQPPEFYRTRLQRFFTYFCMNFSFAHYAQTQMLNAKNIEDSRARISAYFQKVPEDRFKFSV